MVVERGHRIGNHSYNHIKGFRETVKRYLDNIVKADDYLSSNLYRPPHGLMRLKQYRALNKQYRIIMWDLVTRDYDPKLTGEEVLGKVKRYVRNGSIITFHDSIRSIENLRYALPRAIEWLLAQGYEFKVFE
jgi:peptidoglycan/xylan/chitin deacetylase (PgdA/CDA1 family)